MINYKINILKSLKSKDYLYYDFLFGKLFSSSTLTKFKRNDANISMENLNTICYLLGINDLDKLIEFRFDESESAEIINKERR